MKTILKEESLLPAWASNLFDSRRLLNPRLFDFNGDGFDLTNRVPSVNVTENEKEFVLEMAAPGLERKDFKVEVENGMLNISSTKEEETKEEKKNYTRKEYSYQSFSRSFSLPDNCEAEKIVAKYENGILNVTLPKKEQTVPQHAKKIEVA